MRLNENLLQARFNWLTIVAGLFTALFLVALSRAVIDHPPTYDELLHMLSARGVLETGEPRMADGVYDRAEIFTRLVALTFSAFGDTPVAARIPALLAGAVLVTLVVLWTSVRAGLVAGLASGIFLAIMPSTVELSVFSRFYTLHGLAIFIASICAFEAASAPGLNRRFLLLGLVFTASISLAWHLQVTTLIALGAIFAGFAGVLLNDRRHRWVPLLMTHPWQLVVAGASCLFTVIAVVIVFGLAERLDQAPLWAADRTDAWNYYIQRLGRSMPLLWPLFPLAVVASLFRHRRIALFSLVLFGAAFVVHSFAAQKAIRYLYYALPFMCIVMGLAFSTAVEKSRGLLTRTTKRHQIWSLPTVLAVALVTLGLSQEGQLALRWLAVKPSSLDALDAYAEESSWDISSLPELAAAAQTADRVVTSAGVKALYYLGRYDYEINVSVVMETDTGQENGLDRRTGRRVIGQAESLINIIAQAGTTLVVVDNDKYGRWNHVPQEAIDVLDQRCRNLGLPTKRLVHAWFCVQE